MTTSTLKVPELLRQAFHEAAERGYGDVKAEGVVAGKKDTWSSDDEAEGVKKTDAARDPDTGHVPNSELRRLLAHEAAEDDPATPEEGEAE